MQGHFSVQVNQKNHIVATSLQIFGEQISITKSEEVKIISLQYWTKHYDFALMQNALL